MGTKKTNTWSGTESYIADPELQRVVNVAATLGRPLLIRGEPGTGKTLLAHSIADGLKMPLLTWHIKSTTEARDGLYIYDTVQRLYDSRFQDKDVSDINEYIRLGPLGQAFAADERQVLLIDEIDKADIEFPNDLLHELDAMSFRIVETEEVVKAKHRPIVVITSNNEKELPDAFLRRVVFHYIEFPTSTLMADIVRVHFPDLEENLLRQSLELFYRVREVDGLRKPPSTSELVDWIAALLAGGVDPDQLAKSLPYPGTLLKRAQDLRLIRGAGRIR